MWIGDAKQESRKTDSGKLTGEHEGVLERVPRVGFRRCILKNQYCYLLCIEP